MSKPKVQMKSKIQMAENCFNIWSFVIDTFDGAKPRPLNRVEKRRSVSTLSIPGALDRGVEGLI